MGKILNWTFFKKPRPSATKLLFFPKKNKKTRLLYQNWWKRKFKKSQTSLSGIVLINFIISANSVLFWYPTINNSIWARIKDCKRENVLCRVWHFTWVLHTCVILWSNNSSSCTFYCWFSIFKRLFHCPWKKVFKAFKCFLRDDWVSRLNSRLSFCYLVPVGEKCFGLSL